MSAIAMVLQLVRAHYQRDESQFGSTALTLARNAKTPLIRDEIATLVRRGFPRAMGSGSGFSSQRPQSQEMRPLPQAAAPVGALLPLRAATFAELQLDPDVQALLDELVLELEYREELAARNLRARNRLLFHGPPGNGKTSSASALAHALDCQAYCVSIPELVSCYLGETGKNLAKIFESLREGMVVVFDEIDAIGTSRNDDARGSDKERNTTINSLLTLLDRQRGGMIVGTTNRPDMLDPALLRRFDERILFPEPNVSQKRSLGASLAERFSIEPVHVDDCANFDEVTKRIETAARRLVMRELLAADEQEETEGDAKPAFEN